MSIGQELKETRLDDAPISKRADGALRTLARLIGREMAREQFETKRAIRPEQRSLAGPNNHQFSDNITKSTQKM
jgi:hypothetical protein